VSDHRNAAHIFEQVLWHVEAPELFRLRVLSRSVRNYIERLLTSVVVIRDFGATCPFQSALGHGLPWIPAYRVCTPARLSVDEGLGEFTNDPPSPIPGHETYAPLPPGMMTRWTRNLELDFVRPLDMSMAFTYASLVGYLNLLGLNTIRRRQPYSAPLFGHHGLKPTTLVDLDLSRPGSVEGIHRYVRPGIVDVTRDSQALRLHYEGIPNEVVLICDKAVRVEPETIIKSIGITANGGLDWAAVIIQTLHIVLVVDREVCPKPFSFTVPCASMRFATPTFWKTATDYFTVDVLSHEEYAEKVGHEQYRLETVTDTALLIPHYATGAGDLASLLYEVTTDL
jgi:hypothetical protein